MDYIPKPVITSHVRLTDELLELTELLAKNAHDNWAKRRLSEGWKYGKERNDVKKEHPCLIVYEELPELEKEYDRIIALETLKVILALGYEIEKS
ncbi:MAG: RyR domain-containing protein [Syntrophaceae bacterium]